MTLHPHPWHVGGPTFEQRVLPFLAGLQDAHIATLTLLEDLAHDVAALRAAAEPEPVPAPEPESEPERDDVPTGRTHLHPTADVSWRACTEVRTPFGRAWETWAEYRTGGRNRSFRVYCTRRHPAPSPTDR